MLGPSWSSGFEADHGVLARPSSVRLVRIGRSRRRPSGPSFPSTRDMVLLARNEACRDAGSFVVRLNGRIEAVRANSSARPKLNRSNVIPDSTFTASTCGVRGKFSALWRDGFPQFTKQRMTTAIRTQVVIATLRGDRKSRRHQPFCPAEAGPP